MKYIYKFEAMTTPCEIVLFSQDKPKADKVAQIILKEAKRLQKKYNYFSKDSFLYALNSRTIDELDIETKDLLQRAIKYYTKTQKSFDITIATIKDLYKEDSSLDGFLEKKAALLEFVGCEHIDIKKSRLYFDNPYTKIDLGGFVKEYAVDQAVKILKKAKIDSALVNFGGDIYALGKKPNGEKFKVGIKDPKNREKFIKFIQIENEALTTSASYERNITIEGELFSHIISKESMQNVPSSVTVISKNCVESGVFSTALMINPKLSTKNRVILL